MASTRRGVSVHLDKQTLNVGYPTQHSSCINPAVFATRAPSPVSSAAPPVAPRSAAFASPLFPTRLSATSCGPRFGAGLPAGRALVLRSYGLRFGASPPAGRGRGSECRRSSLSLSMGGCWRLGGPWFGSESQELPFGFNDWVLATWRATVWWR